MISRTSAAPLSQQRRVGRRALLHPLQERVERRRELLGGRPPGSGSVRARSSSAPSSSAASNSRRLLGK